MEREEGGAEDSKRRHRDEWGGREGLGGSSRDRRKGPLMDGKYHSRQQQVDPPRSMS